MRTKWFFLILAILLTLAVAPAYAQGPGTAGDQVVFGRDVIVRAGETVHGDLVAFGGRVTVENGGRVTGDLVAVGGNVSLAGEVDGTLAALGGSVQLEGTAVVGGDLVLTGGTVSRAEGARVEGNTVEGFDFGRFLSQASQPVRPFAPQVEFERPILFNRIWGIFQAMLTTVGVTILGALVVLLLPRETRRVAQTAVHAPLASLGMGFLTLLAAAFLLPVLAVVSAILLIVCIGVFGFALLVLLGVALVAALVYGWIAVGLLVGERILELLKVEERVPLVSVVIGILLISLISAVPCLGFIFAVLAGSVGLGAVILSRGGTQAYPGPALSPVPA
jgi:hypothetical protein